VTAAIPRLWGFAWVDLAMLAIGALALGVELVSFFTGTSPVISVVMRHCGQRWSWEPYLFGLLCGHFYAPAMPWSMFGWADRPWWFWLVWIAIAAALVARDIFIPTWFSLAGSFACCLLGLLCGAVFWNQG
jgi:hypothetical protein